jgi:acyl carrier protein
MEGSMEKKQIEEKLKNIIAERLEVKLEKIKSESKFREDLGIDSFGLVEMLFEIKDKFGLVISDQESKSMVRFKDAVDFISRKLEER